MKVTKKQIIGIVIWIVFIITSAIASISIFNDNMQTDTYKYLFLLPLGFMFICFLFYGLFKNVLAKPIILLFVLLFFIRNTIAPLLLMLSRYQAFFNNISQNDVFWATILMVYETLCVFISIYYFSNKKYKKNTTIDTSNRLGIFKFMLSILTIICILGFALYPENFDRFESIFDFGRSAIHYKVEATQYSDTRIISSLIWVVFPWLQFLYSIITMCWIRRKLGDTALGLFCSFLVVLLQGFILYGANGWIVILLVTLFYVMYKLFNSHRITIMLTMSAAMALFIISIAIVKSAQWGDYNIISLLLQGYLPGVTNFAGIFSLPQIDKLQYLFYDFYNMLIFKDALFGLKGDRLASYYTQYNSALSQIIPCTAQIYYYLGFIFSPIFSALCVKWALLYNHKAENEKDIIKSAICFFEAIYITITPVMYNMTILGLCLVSFVWPLQILAKFIDGSMNRNKGICK